jgi:hypothetical protein
LAGRKTACPAQLLDPHWATRPPTEATSVYKRCSRNSFTFTQKIRIALKVDDPSGEHFIGAEIASVCKSKSGARHFKCDAPDPLGLGIKLVAV